MRSTILMTLFLALFTNLHAQNDINTQKIIKEFEKYCPIYILDNYCSQTGLTKIIQEAKLDDRIGGINTTNQYNAWKQPEIVIKYYNNIIVFEKHQTAEYLGIFRIYFNSHEDLKAFTQYYKYLMGFVNDEEDPNRYYYEDGSMNALIQNSYPEKKLYFASCFVFQQEYCGQTVTIGTQVWTSKNLNVATYRNGDVIPQVQDQAAWSKLTTGAWCYYNNDASNGTKYGKLYNWYAVNDPRGLAPNGYHIPRDAEWTKLTDYLGGVSEAGAKMKSTSGWYNNGNGTNSSGFSGLPGGGRKSAGTFNNVENFSSWWSSAEFSTYDAWLRFLEYNNGNVYRGSGLKKNGFYVRCLRD